MRPIGMRTPSLPLVAAVLVLAAGCGPAATSPGPADEPASTAGSGPAPAATTPDSAAPSAHPSPSVRPTTPARRPPHTGSTPGPDMPRDLVGPPLELTGTVHVGSGCVVLEVRGRRWALTGPLAGSLTDGTTVTVRGRPTRVPAGCDADGALTVRSVA